MQNIIRLLQKFRVILLFALLQLICLFFILVGNNPFHRESFASSSNYVVGGVYEISSNVTSYFTLKDQVAQVQEQNAELLKSIYGHSIQVGETYTRVDDTVYLQQYDFIPIKIINSSITLPQNMVTIDKGKHNSIDVRMGVIGVNGVIGYTQGVSEHYAVVIPLINPKAKLFVQHETEKATGELFWDPTVNDWSTASIKDVVSSANMEIGDLFVTFGGAQIFPQGIPVGRIIEMENLPGQDYKNIVIELSEDFGRLHNGIVVTNKFAAEQDELEKSIIE
ncbi:MAG: rod shape-determining protein MreC [Parvicella sp.]|jgi:rod shape-determining protein MreC